MHSKLAHVFLGIAMTLSIATHAQSVNEVQASVPKQVLLPNGWSLSPAGQALPLGDLPLNMAVSPDGQTLAVLNCGYGVQSVELFNTRSRKRLDSFKLAQAWLGVCFGDGGHSLYVSGGNDDILIRFDIKGNRLIPEDTLTLGLAWPKNKISPAGIVVDDKYHEVFAVTKEDSALYIGDTRTMKVVSRIPLGSEAYTCVLSPDQEQLYISLWGGRGIDVFDIPSRQFIRHFETGDHPNDMALTKNGRYLFVANANSNTVTVIDLIQEKVIQTLNAALYPHSPTGSTTNSVAISHDQKTLYVANADNNSLAVFDISNPSNIASKGFIPVGWYPTCVRVSSGLIWVSNGKGFTSMANPNGPQPASPFERTPYQKGIRSEKGPIQYIGGLFLGTLSYIHPPTASQQASYTKQVYRNTPYHPSDELQASGQAGNPIPIKPGSKTPIKYVFYIIKENRTYDQVLGDIKEGNGDSSLCLFPERITPNEHALVNHFALLDNFYVNAEVSADGHNWSTAAYANDFVEKTWPTNYSGRGGNYDYEGTRSIAYPSRGFIWNYCKRAGISYRTYGEFAHDGEEPILPAIRGHYCPGFADFNLSVHDITREAVWEHDFDSLVAHHALPRLNTLRFPNDHTSGMQKGAFSPFALVADNDLAVGRFVEHLSHSPVWDSSVVFILEDDAQNGPDHVDAHRSPVYVIGPFVKHHYVDHTMYTTAGVLRTIELILGLPPMSQYDAAATPLWHSFTSKPDTRPYSALPANVDINQRNLADNELSRESARFDLSKEDQVPDQIFNEVIWKGIKGINVVMPAPVHSAYILTASIKHDDD